MKEMAYVQRTVIAGRVRETKKMFTSRVHSEKAERGRSHKADPEAIERSHEKEREDKLRWKINANFDAGDLHIVLHYYDKEIGLEEAEEDKKSFLRILREKCRRLGKVWKYIACTETKRMTNIHHHILLPDMELSIIRDCWSQVLGERGGNISVKPMDERGNHAKLANYLMKETRATVQRWKEKGKRYKRFNCAQGMEQPKPTYQIIAAQNWAREPRAHKGYIILKTETGENAATGIHAESGWPWQEYFELRIDDRPNINRRE